jgi:hypothetical protein
MISYQNDRKCTTADSRRRRDRERVFQCMDRYAPQQRPQFGTVVCPAGRARRHRLDRVAEAMKVVM